jgi:hypothetical protein
MQAAILAVMCRTHIVERKARQAKGLHFSLLAAMLEIAERGSS